MAYVAIDSETRIVRHEENMARTGCARSISVIILVRRLDVSRVANGDLCRRDKAMPQRWELEGILPYLCRRSGRYSRPVK